MAFLTTLTVDDVREHAPRLYSQIIERETGRVVREADAAALSDDEIERQVRNDPRIVALVRENEELAADISIKLARLDEMQAEQNREQVAEYVVAVIRECAPGLTERQVEHVALRDEFVGATVGEKGAYADAETLGRVVREATQEFLQALGPAAQKQARQQRRSGEIAGLGRRSTTAPVREAGLDFRTRPNAVVLAGLHLDFHADPYRGFDVSPGAAAGASGTVREVASGRGNQAATVQDGILAGLHIDFHN